MKVLRCMRALSALAILLLPGTGGFAQSFVETAAGPLPDREFFNVVVCGVPPGEACKESPLLWPSNVANGLAVQLHAKGADPTWLSQVQAALDAAVGKLNRVSPSLQLTIMTDQTRKADIHIHLSALQAGGTILGTHSNLDGTAIEGAAVNIDFNDNRQITRAVIVLAADIAPWELSSIMLEELTQALGPIHDIRNSAYEGVSIFSEDSNAQTELGPQDRMVLRRLYP